MFDWKKWFLMTVLFCWGQGSYASLFVGGVTGKPASGVVEAKEKKPRSSADFLFKQDSTPEEDYQAGILAYNRSELIEAQGIFERAASRGHTGAMVRLGEILDRSGFVNEAAKTYLKAANLGNADAMYYLGVMMLDLNAYDLTKSDVTVDPIAARNWIQKAAELGQEDSLKLISGLYIHGSASNSRGITISDEERTDAEVVKWIDIAIEKINDPEAMEALATAYRSGKYGFEIDTKLADDWVNKAKQAKGVKEEEVKKKSKKKRI